MKRIDSTLIICLMMLLTIFSCKKTEQQQKSNFELLTSHSWNTQQILNSPSRINSKVPPMEYYCYSPDGSYTHSANSIHEKGIWAWKSKDREITLKLYEENTLIKTIHISIITINNTILHTIQYEEGQNPNNYKEIMQYAIPANTSSSTYNSYQSY